MFKEEKDICPKATRCPLFDGRLLSIPQAAESYKMLYCQAGREKYTVCKRYQTSERVGTCGKFVMPNSSLTVDEIIQKMREQGLIN